MSKHWKCPVHDLGGCQCGPIKGEVAKEGEQAQLIRELAERTETELTDHQAIRVRRLMTADENLAFIDAAGAVLEEDRRRLE